MRKAPKYTLEDWPTSDRDAWNAHMSSDISFFARGKFSRWSPETKRQAFYAYSRWLVFLSTDHPEALGAVPAARLTPTRLEGFIRMIAQDVTAQTVVSTLTHLINALHVVTPDFDTRSLRLTQRRFSRRIERPDKRSRMQPAADVSLLGFELMDQAASIPDAREAARSFRDGLMIAILISSTLRRKNLASLEINRHLLRIGPHYRLIVEAKEVKSRRRIDQPLPEELSPYIEAYLNDYRLRFPRANEYAALWLSSKGSAMCKEAIWDAVRRRTLAKFGQPVNLHLCRDIAATSAPNLGSALLGHSKPTMTDLHYRRSDPLTASRKLGAVIAVLRAEAKTTKTVARASEAADATLPERSARKSTEEAIV